MCTYVQMYVNIYTCIYTYVCITCLCTYIYMHLYIITCIYALMTLMLHFAERDAADGRSFADWIYLKDIYISMYIFTYILDIFVYIQTHTQIWIYFNVFILRQRWIWFRSFLSQGEILQVADRFRIETMLERSLAIFERGLRVENAIQHLVWVFVCVYVFVCVCVCVCIARVFTFLFLPHYVQCHTF